MISLDNVQDREKFWLEDITHLFGNGRYTKFVPRYEMTRAEQLNAISRFSIYMIILLFLFGYHQDWLAFPVIILIIAIVLYNFNKTDQKGTEKELDRILQQRKEKHVEDIKLDIKEYTHDGDDPKKLLDIQKYGPDYTEKTNQAIFPEDGQYYVEAGNYDADGRLCVGPKSLPPKNGNTQSESIFTAAEIEDYQKNTCRRPTPDNPFMNPNFTDFNAGPIPAACNVDDEQIEDSMKVNYNHELFRDVDEIWERENSQRQFYTIPNTAVPNNQIEFAKWLYAVPDSQLCKSGGDCNRWEDLRWKRDNYKR